MIDCMPVIAADYEEAAELIRKTFESGIEIAEWRLDGLKGPVDIAEVMKISRMVKEDIGKKLIVTMRTEINGGGRNLDPSKYIWMMRRIAEAAEPDFIDVEMNNCGGDAYVKQLINTVHSYGVKVILSYHNLIRTEKERDIAMRLRRMKYLGADIPKVAYMPGDDEDVQRLINAAMSVQEEVAPMIAISMGEKGQITRKEGDRFGSVINFLKPVGSRSFICDGTGQMSRNEE